MTPLRVMTFNIRNNRAKDGENHWDYRREFVADLIRRHQVDVLGVQEAYREQGDHLLAALPEYGKIGVGREDGKALGEHSQIFYRKDRLRVQEHGTFWFSETPEVPGSRSWGNRLTRACSWARLEDLSPGRSFYVYNLHLDHESQPSRERSVELLLERIRRREHPDPVLAMGDFNAGEGNPAIELVKQSASPSLRDTFRVAHPDETAAGTFHGFAGGVQGEKIDYLFASEEFHVAEASILRESRDGRFPSDHYPVAALLEW